MGGRSRSHCGYVAVTLLFYSLFKPVNRSLSLAPGIVGEGALTLWLLSKGVAMPGPARSA
jgi:hypothetical protein